MDKPRSLITRSELDQIKAMASIYFFKDHLPKQRKVNQTVDRNSVKKIRNYIKQRSMFEQVNSNEEFGSNAPLRLSSLSLAINQSVLSDQSNHEVSKGKSKPQNLNERYVDLVRHTLMV